MAKAQITGTIIFCLPPSLIALLIHHLLQSLLKCTAPSLDGLTKLGDLLSVTMQVSRWQRIATIPEEQFEQHLQESDSGLVAFDVF